MNAYWLAWCWYLKQAAEPWWEVVLVFFSKSWITRWTFVLLDEGEEGLHFRGFGFGVGLGGAAERGLVGAACCCVVGSVVLEEAGGVWCGVSGEREGGRVGGGSLCKDDLLSPDDENEPKIHEWGKHCDKDGTQLRLKEYTRRKRCTDGIDVVDVGYRQFDVC